jgi:hypothetical protein
LDTTFVDAILTHLNLLAGSCSNPFLGLFPVFVKEEEPTLSTSLDQLIRFSNQFGSKDPWRELIISCDRAGFRVPGDLGDFWRWVDKVGGDIRGLRDGRGAF